MNVTMDISDSFGSDYSRIGFQKTMSVHFEELKGDQDLIRQKTTEIRKTFAALVKREKDFEDRKKKMEGEGSVQDWGDMESQQVWVYDEEMALATAQSEFSQERQDLMGCIKVWAQDCANQLAIFPGFNVESRKKRAIDFINLMKKFLKATRPLGEDEEEGEEDLQWLNRKETDLPKAREDTRQLRDRLRERDGSQTKRVHSPSAASKSFASSTPEVLRESKKGGKGEEPRSNLAQLETGTEVDEESSGCPVAKEKNDIYNPSHVCVEEKGDKEMEDEPSGPDYDRVKKEESLQDSKQGGKRKVKKMKVRKRKERRGEKRKKGMLTRIQSWKGERCV